MRVKVLSKLKSVSGLLSVCLPTDNDTATPSETRSILLDGFSDVESTDNRQTPVVVYSFIWAI